MRKALKLRTEIVITSGVLVGAALLFTIFLLLRLSESYLLDQSLSFHIRQTENLSQALQHLPEKKLPQVLENFALTNDLISWRLVDQQMTPLLASANPSDQSRSRQNLRLALLRQSPEIQVSYPKSWQLWLEILPPEKQFAEITTAVFRESTVQALQIRYPLHNIHQQMRFLALLAISVCLAYGLILVITAVLVFNRAVILPITLLTGSTRKFAEGDLNQRVKETGPLEIAELGSAFNRMADSLQAGITTQQQQYLKLEQTHNDLVETRQHLAHSERLASVGNLTSGIAHELGNPLSAVIGYLELLKQKIDNSGNHDLIVRALDETSRMDQLIKEMLDFTTPGSASESFPCCPAEVLDRSCNLLQLQGALKDRQLSCQWDADLPMVKIAPLKLQQILINLILNARDSTSENGFIAVSGTLENTQIIISVEDNGHGIPAEQIKSIFDPFFTTKASGKGRGLGLYISFQLASEVGGSLQVSSNLGHGSCFTLTLPILQPAPFPETH